MKSQLNCVKARDKLSTVSVRVRPEIKLKIESGGKPKTCSKISQLVVKYIELLPKFYHDLQLMSDVEIHALFHQSVYTTLDIVEGGVYALFNNPVITESNDTHL